MQCHYHLDREARTQCNHCREPLCDQCAIPKDNIFLCSRCLALEAAREAVDGIDSRMEEKQRKTEMLDERNRFKKNLRRTLTWGTLIIALCVVIYQASGFISAFQNDDKPLRNGTIETNAITDECIRNLWNAAKLLQEEKLPGPELVCPASKRPFIITREDGDVVARSPNPELYGFREIRVSKLHPVPEVIK